MASSSVQDVRWSDLAVKNSISSHAATANQGVGVRLLTLFTI